jgi:hypothetical protein
MFEMPDPFGRTKPGKPRYGAGPMTRGQARAWSAGMEVAYGLIGMGLVGFAIDYIVGTTPRWMLILGGVGLVWGVYRFIRAGLEINATASREIRGRTFQMLEDPLPKDPEPASESDTRGEVLDQADPDRARS